MVSSYIPVKMKFMKLLQSLLSFEVSCTRMSSHSTVYVSGIQPTGVPHLGNYFGFIKPWIDIQNRLSSAETMYLSIADYHAISVQFVAPEQMRTNLLQMAASLLASGVDPEKTILFQQSTIPEHTNLMYILGSLQTVARLQRMPQFKDKAKQFPNGDVPINLQTYPILQAADVLLYKGTHVPVGDDQTQHMILLRELATKFNSRFQRQFFPIPIQVTSTCNRLRSLQDPTKKMSKSDSSERARIAITDSGEVIASKCAKALSDMNPEITYDPQQRPAVSSLVSLYAAVSAKSVDEVVDECRGLDTRGFKHNLAEQIDVHLAPIRASYAHLLSKPEQLVDILRFGNSKARLCAAQTMDEVREIIGFNISAANCGTDRLASVVD